MPYPDAAQLRERIEALRELLPLKLGPEIAELEDLAGEISELEPQEAEDWALDIVVRIRLEDQLGRHAGEILAAAADLEAALALHRPAL